MFDCNVILIKLVIFINMLNVHENSGTHLGEDGKGFLCDLRAKNSGWHIKTIKRHTYCMNV